MRNLLPTLFLLACLPGSAIAAPLSALELGDAQTQLTAATNQDGFGLQVAADGDTVAIAAPYFQEVGSQIRGAGFVSQRGPNGWSPLVKLVNGDPAVAGSFAQSVALSGDTLVFGSWRNSPYIGKADIFVRVGDIWTHQIKLAPANATGAFGVSVTLKGDDLLVGDEQAQLVTVYRRIGEIWTEVQQLAPPTTVLGSRFGESVAIDGNLVAIGRPYFPSLQSRKGQVLLYRRASADAPFVLEYSYTMTGGGDSPELGGSISGIAINGNRVLVGAPSYDHRFNGPFRASGAVVALEHDGANWVSQLLLPSELGGTGWFGMAIAMDASRALIGASGGSNVKVYGFVRGASQWLESQRVSSSASAVRFGRSIAIGDGYAVVGAPGNYFQPGADAGTAHIYPLTDVLVPDTAIALSRTSIPGCGTWPSVVSATWSSDGQYCTAVSQGSLSNSSWGDASCPLATSACPDPLDFRVLPASGSTQFVTGQTTSLGQYLDGTLAVECTNTSGHSARAATPLTVTGAFSADCPTPSHTVAAALSQPPLALPNGTFEMRANVTNPLAQSLYAIARHGSHGSVNARIEGAELVLTYAPDYATVGGQSQVSDNIGAAVSNGSHAVQSGYNITVQLAVFGNGFE